MNPRTGVVVDKDSPTDEELAEALSRNFEKPGFQTLDHIPMFHCERCLIYCPVGNWKEKFADHGLSDREVK